MEKPARPVAGRLPVLNRVYVEKRSFSVGVEAIFEAVGNGVGVLIEAGLESSHAPAEIFGGGMAVMIGDIGKRHLDPT
jgi:hypothetical protein